MEKTENKEVTPWVHKEMSGLREFIDTFAYYFSKGANAEKVSMDAELFFSFLQIVRSSKVESREELGGHSAVWAVKSQLEQCKVFTATQSSQVIEEGLKVKSGYDGDFTPYLEWPTD